MEGLYHVWFSTKGGKQALAGDLGDEVSQLLIDIAQRAGIRLLELEIASDHIHLLVALAGAQTLPLRNAPAQGRYLTSRLPQVSGTQGPGPQLVLAEGIRLA